LTTIRLRSHGLGLLAAALLAACAGQPAPEPESPPTPTLAKKVDEAAMLPLLGYLQLLLQMSPQELQRERGVLVAIPQTPATQVRLAMLLGQARGPADLVRALGLLDGVLKSPGAGGGQPCTRWGRALARSEPGAFEARVAERQAPAAFEEHPAPPQ